jgi:hypothetical protein
MPATGREPGRDANQTFFHLIQAIHNQAARKAGGYEDRYFSIGGRSVRMRFAGGVIAGLLTPALAHTAVPVVEAPELTVLLWDDASTGTGLPVALARYFDSLGEWWKHLGPRGEIRQRTDERFWSAFHLGPNIFSILDREKSLAMYWVQRAESLPYYEIGSPLRTILHWWADQYPFQFVHAGAVGVPGGGVLLVGKGGTGKSTTALACLDAGMRYMSDDYCLVRAGSSPLIHSVYNTAKLRGAADVRRFPRLAPLIINTTRLDDDKALLFLYQHFPEQVCRDLPLKAILMPQVTGGKGARLRPASRAEVLMALAPSTLFQLPGAGEAAFTTMSQVVCSVPGYHLEVGSDFAAIPRVIQELLADG